MSNNTAHIGIVGTFEDYAEFYRGNNAAPYHYIAELIRNNCGTLGGNSHLLDIGCGGAFTVDKLQKYFKSISLMEPNPYFRSKWFKEKERQWINDGTHILHLYPFTIEQTTKNHLIEKNTMDAIIVYHSIYHFNLEILHTTMQAITSYLKPNGVCVISVLDDDDKFAKIYRKLSPQYQLSTTLEEILKTIPNINYKKEYESNEFTNDFNAQLNIAKWVFIQDCMNQNYFADGLTEEQLNSVDEECKKFIQEYFTKSKVKTQDGSIKIMYKTTYRSVHFVIKKRNYPSKL